MRTESSRAGMGAAGIGCTAILGELATGERSVTELVESTGLSQPNVSNHLGRLRSRGLVSCRRDGRQVIYRLICGDQAAEPCCEEAVAAHSTHFDPEGPTLGQIAAQFMDAALDLDQERSAQVLDEGVREGARWQDLYLHVLAPTLVHVGELWEAGSVSIAYEHAVTSIVVRMLHRLSSAISPMLLPTAPTALVACVEGELHTVGGRMAADFLAAGGWRTWFLDTHLSAEHLVQAMRQRAPDAVVLCITKREHEESLRRTAERLRRWRGEQPTPLLVGGGAYFAGGQHFEGLDLCGTDPVLVTAEMNRRIARLRELPGALGHLGCTGDPLWRSCYEDETDAAKAANAAGAASVTSQTTIETPLR